MCSPSNVCYTNTTRQNTPATNSRRQQSEASDLSTVRDIPPATRITAVTDTDTHTETATDPSPRILVARQGEIRTTDEGSQQVSKGMSNLVFGTGRAHSPQYCVNSEKKRILKGKGTPNAFPPKSHTPSLAATTLSHNNKGHTNAQKFTFNDTMVSSSPAENSNDHNFTHQRNPSISNTPPDASSKSKHELIRNPKLPPPLMLSSDERQYLQYDPTLKDSPSPRDVTQDRHLYKTSGSESQGTYNHSHQIDFHPVPRVSLSHMWSQTSYTPRSPHCGEMRQESSPISSASNSSVASPDDWSSNNDGNNMRHQPHSSPSTLRSQHYTNLPIYRQQQTRPRAPFNLKPRPNNTYQPPQKQFEGQAQYAPYWNQQTGSYHASSQASPQANTITHPHGTHHNRLSHPILTLTPLPSTTNTTGILSPPARTSPEILKTLLRKKACLYEPGTSRAITLLTWLVARRLALQYGYFSRQHLQSGVHAIVGDKISSGIITRTKVNRCMQVILNSCFYYIIPKPDGTEESGESFRRFFERTVVDDTHLIKTLPEPWNDLEISEETMVDRNCDSPVLAEMKEDEDDNGRSHSSGGKRQVLLCFNENVRCAEDVLRCHNDFIRDSAISANLLLTPEEWRSFYLCKDEKNTCTTPMKKGTTDDIYNSYLSFDMPADVEESLAFKENISDTGDGGVDILGQMTTSELVKFRTTWCCKRYEHDATLCRFAHIDVNKGWLRRNPAQMEYCAIMCPKTNIVNNKSSSIDGCYLNACEDGVQCKFAHSKEEVAYHPKNYKTKVCQSTKKGSHCACDMRDICPYLHTSGHYFCTSTPPRSLTRHIGRRMNDTPCRIKGHLIGGKHPTPSIGSTDVGSYARAGAPMLYLSPAPTSEFDKTLHFPGLCSLYRRNCATHYAHDVASKNTEYSNFGDNWVQTVPLPSIGKPVENSFSLFGVI